MNWRWAIFPIAAMLMASAAQAQDGAQQELDHLLIGTAPDRIASMRAICALGDAPKARAVIRSAGMEASSAGAWCVTVLTRAGRDGQLGYLRDVRSSKLTPAIAFDNGFVEAFLKHEPIPSGLPAMAMLLPIADRCLDQKEPNASLCTAAGQVLGMRAASGESVTAN